MKSRCPARTLSGRKPDRRDDAWAVERDTIMVDPRGPRLSKTCGDLLHGRGRRCPPYNPRAASTVVDLVRVPGANGACRLGASVTRAGCRGGQVRGSMDFGGCGAIDTRTTHTLLGHTYVVVVPAGILVGNLKASLSIHLWRCVGPCAYPHPPIVGL